ncbi:MAG TPA: radical SAM protein [Proteobacteria bacterium]|nr:radical SAM protein [Pseudomonadota bacterium]
MVNENLNQAPAACSVCPRACRVDRLAGELGFCRIPAAVQVSHAGLHLGEEPPISGVRGSGTIFFSGCNLRCIFCQNYQISQEFSQPSRGMTIAELAVAMLRLEQQGAHNLNFVSPSHVAFQVAEAIATARAQGLTVPVVYNSNGYDAPAALRRLRGLVDIYLPDLKYLENGLGRRFSDVTDYADVAPLVIAEMLNQVGHLQTDAEGLAVRGLLVRHLVLPGYIDNSLRVLDFLAGLSRDIFVSIMAQYSPQYKAMFDPVISRTLRQDEYDRVVEHALTLGLDNAFVQELASQDHYLPDFEREDPFL